MKTFVFSVTRTETYSTEFAVQAESVEAAQRAAENIAEEYDFDGIDYDGGENEVRCDGECEGEDANYLAVEDNGDYRPYMAVREYER